MFKKLTKLQSQEFNFRKVMRKLIKLTIMNQTLRAYWRVLFGCKKSRRAQLGIEPRTSRNGQMDSSNPKARIILLDH